MTVGKKLTVDDYRIVASERGITWVSDSIPSTSHKKTTWQCSAGHEWPACYSDIRKGSNCPYCTGTASKTANDYHLIAQRNNLEWIGALPPTVSKKTRWRCPAGHEWETVYWVVNRGSGCPHCAGTVPKTLENYLSLAASRGFELVGEIPRTTEIKTRWRCSKGHEWESRFQDIQAGSNCPNCAQAIPKNASDYHKNAQLHNIQWIGELPQNSHQPTRWKCAVGHEWDSPYHTVVSGAGCPTCNAKGVDDYLQLASDRGIKWVGKSPCLATIKTRWQCRNGHEWNALYSNVARGTGCPICAGKVPKTDDDYRALANERSIIWVGNLPRTVTNTTRWRCLVGHEWDANHSNIKRGGGCPLCRNMINGVMTSKPQLAIQKMLGGEINYRVKPYAIDIALTISGINIAVEYDCWYWHQGREGHDLKRNAFLAAHGWRVLRIKTSTQLPTRHQLESAVSVLISGTTYTEIVLKGWGGN